MIKPLTACLFALASAAHADIMVKKGATAELKVEYTFASTGKSGTANSGDIREWSARRVVTIVAKYAADAPQPFGAMHAKSADQLADIQDLKAKATATHAKMQPTMADMMKIVRECNEEETCISKRVSDYGNAMSVPSDMKATKDAIDDMGKYSSARYQLWRSTSQTGAYQIEEHSTHQVFEMTCTAAKICKQTVTTQGSGAIPSPAGGRSVAGAAMFEVDGLTNDVVLTLPMALVPLPTETQVATTIPNDKTTGGRTHAKPMGLGIKPITVKLAGKRLSATGTQTLKIEGKGIEGGTLTVNWTLAAK